MPDFVNHMYDDASSLGKVQSFIGLVIAIIIGLVLIIIGYYYVSSSNQYIITLGTITAVNCQNIIQNNTTKTTNTNTTNTNTIMCILNIEYKDNNTVFYTNNLTVNKSIYSVGQSIQIEYLKSNPNQIRLPTLSDMTFGYISSGISIVIVLGGLLNYYLSSNYKLYASAQGVKSVYGIFKI